MKWVFWVVRALSLALLLFAAPAVAGPNDGLPKVATNLDRATPRRTFDGFVQATRAGDFLRAAHFLDLRNIPRNKQSTEGTELARKLSYVIDRQLTIDVGTISDVVDGGAGSQALVVVGTVFVDDEPVPISLARVRFDDGVSRWVVARTTVSMVPELYKEHGAHGWEDRIPRILVTMRFFGIEAWQWLALFAALCVAWLAGYLLGTLLIGVGRRIAKRTSTPWDDELVTAARGPVRLILAVFVLWAIDDPLHFSPALAKIADKIAFPILVVSVAWLIMSAIGVLTQWILAGLPSEPGDELKSRGLRTQLTVMRRVTSVILVVCACAVILMQFEFVRSVGVSLLASAGLVGVVLGLAAQKSLAGVIAGIQLSITQPIRIGDTVVIEGEIGNIEEINLTYVVVKIWDERRLVVPIQKFLDSSFQNWTRVTREMHGTVMFAVDYTAPVQRIRDALEQVVKNDPRWDGRACKLHVTEHGDKTIVLRALVSAANADNLWELRCAVREKMLSFLSELDGGKFLAQLRSRPVEPPPPAPV